MAVIKFNVQKCPPLADTQASIHLWTSFTPLAMDFCGKAVQIRYNASINLWIVLGFCCSLW